MRGLAPDDARLFDEASRATLRIAASELAWLLDRGYAQASSLALVGDRHRLEARQRMALRRGVCGDRARDARIAKALPREGLAGADVLVDGFNVLVTIETALAGGVVVEGVDGALRDLAGLRGSYRIVEETSRALDAIGRVLASATPSSITWLLDAPVSNSGRLRATILAHAWPAETRVELVPDPDPLLASAANVASSDGPILDACFSWHPLARHAIDEAAARPLFVSLRAP